MSSDAVLHQLEREIREHVTALRASIALLEHLAAQGSSNPEALQRMKLQTDQLWIAFREFLRAEGIAIDPG